MAGGGIIPTLRETWLIQNLAHWQLATMLTVLDEDGWRAAQDLLREYGRRPEYQQIKSEGEAQ